MKSASSPFAIRVTSRKIPEWRRKLAAGWVFFDTPFSRASVQWPMHPVRSNPPGSVYGEEYKLHFSHHVWRPGTSQIAAFGGGRGGGRGNDIQAFDFGLEQPDWQFWMQPTPTPKLSFLLIGSANQLANDGRLDGISLWDQTKNLDDTPRQQHQGSGSFIIDDTLYIMDTCGPGDEDGGIWAKDGKTTSNRLWAWKIAANLALPGGQAGTPQRRWQAWDMALTYTAPKELEPLPRDHSGAAAYAITVYAGNWHGPHWTGSDGKAYTYSYYGNSFRFDPVGGKWDQITEFYQKLPTKDVALGETVWCEDIKRKRMFACYAAPGPDVHLPQAMFLCFQTPDYQLNSSVTWEDDPSQPGATEALAFPHYRNRNGVRARFSLDATTDRVTLEPGASLGGEGQLVAFGLAAQKRSEVAASFDTAAVEVVYFVRSPSGQSFQLSLTSKGPIVDIKQSMALSAAGETMEQVTDSLQGSVNVAYCPDDDAFYAVTNTMPIAQWMGADGGMRLGGVWRLKIDPAAPNKLQVKCILANPSAGSKWIRDHAAAINGAAAGTPPVLDKIRDDGPYRRIHYLPDLKGIGFIPQNWGASGQAWFLATGAI